MAVGMQNRHRKSRCHVVTADKKKQKPENVVSRMCNAQKTPQNVPKSWKRNRKTTVHDRSKGCMAQLFPTTLPQPSSWQPPLSWRHILPHPRPSRLQPLSPPLLARPFPPALPTSRRTTSIPHPRSLTTTKALQLAKSVPTVRAPGLRLGIRSSRRPAQTPTQRFRHGNTSATTHACGLRRATMQNPSRAPRVRWPE